MTMRVVTVILVLAALALVCSAIIHGKIQIERAIIIAKLSKL